MPMITQPQWHSTALRIVQPALIERLCSHNQHVSLMFTGVKADGPPQAQSSLQGFPPALLSDWKISLSVPHACPAIALLSPTHPSGT